MIKFILNEPEDDIDERLKDFPFYSPILCLFLV